MIVQFFCVVLALRVTRQFHKGRLLWMCTIGLVTWALVPLMWCRVESALAGAAGFRSVLLVFGSLLIVLRGYLLYRRQRLAVEKFTGSENVGLKRRVGGQGG